MYDVPVWLNDIQYNHVEKFLINSKCKYIVITTEEEVDFGDFEHYVYKFTNDIDVKILREELRTSKSNCGTSIIINDHGKCHVCERYVTVLERHGKDSVGNIYNRRGYECSHVWYDIGYHTVHTHHKNWQKKEKGCND